MGPVPVLKQLLSYAHEPLTAAELAQIRHSMARGTPYGEETWIKRTAARLGLEASLRPHGRPRKLEK